MGLKKKLVLIIISFLILIMIFVRAVIKQLPVNEIENNDSVVQVEGEDVKRATVAKMLGLLFYTKEELAGLERVISYSDSDSSKWYDKYLNGLYIQGILEQNPKTNTFRPEDSMTYGECKEFLRFICVNAAALENKALPSYDSLISELAPYFTGEDDKNILLSEWLSIYQVLLEKFNGQIGNGTALVETKNLFLLATPSNVAELDANQAITDKGKFSFEGLNLDSYINTKIEVYVKQDEVICVTNSLEEEVTLNNVWIVNGNDNKIEAFYGGVRLNFSSQNPLSKQINSVIGNLVISKKMVTKISIKPDIVNAKVLVANDKYIELENYGKLSLEEDYKIYRIYGELSSEQANGILVGYQATDFVVSNGKISAALIKEPIKAKNIRVLIKTTGFDDVYHKEVVLTCEQPFTISYGKKTKEFKANEEVTIDKDSSLLKDGRLHVETKQEGKIKLCSITRNGLNPSYRGKIEVASNDQGLTIINELPIEEYLYAVIPSEMPTSYGKEALKVQAICARSYAYTQLLANRCSQYGANVDDSVSYQVYNNAPEDENSIYAVKDTYGKVMTYEGDVILAYYFSTSSGHTASAEDVWMSEKEIPYLTASLQTKEGKAVDFTKEDAFREFLSKKPYTTYDSEFAWYRWKTQISALDLKRVIDEKLYTRYYANPKLIQTLGTDGKYHSIPIDTVGEVKNIKVSQRKSGGIITELIIEGSKNTIKVTTEYNIRTLLAPIYDKIIRQDQSEVESLSMLPSAFFVIDKVLEENKSAFIFTGGGYGHGVGMSQNGVKGMVDQGFQYDEILKHYYKGVNIEVIY